MLDMKGSAQKLRFDLTDHIAWGATHKRRELYELAAYVRKLAEK